MKYQDTAYPNSDIAFKGKLQTTDYVIIMSGHSLSLFEGVYCWCSYRHDLPGTQVMLCTVPTMADQLTERKHVQAQ